MTDSWARLTGKVRAQAKRALTRGPCLAARIRYVNTFLLSEIWYTAQILPAPNKYAQLTTAIAWYTLQRPQQMGGWEIPDIEAKCTALLYRMYLQGQWNATVIAAWLQTWNRTGRQAIPPHATTFPTELDYLYVYGVNMAYITPPEQDEPPPPTDASADISTPYYTVWHWH